MKMKELNTVPARAGMNVALIFMFLFCFLPAIAQQVLPVIKANSRQVTIKDGPVLLKGIWSLSPEVRPDRYQVLKSSLEKTVTFLTDIDSISFLVRPGNTYNFAVLLNDKDTCYTQIVAEGDTAGSNRLSPLIGREQQAMDFMIFRDYMEKEHAGLYRYKSQVEINKIFDDAFLSIKGPSEKLDFGKLIMHVISEVQDGHTGTNLSSLILSTYMNREKLFPLLLYFDQRTAKVRCGKLDGFPPETEILSINGIKIDKIKKVLFSYLPGDGQIQSKKRQTLNNGSFGFLYRLVFGTFEQFRITYKTSAGKAEFANIKASFSSDFDCDTNNPGSSAKDLQISYPSAESAVLTVKSFDPGRLARAALDFPKFLEQVFNEFSTRKTEKLIIDLRGNGGGLDEYGALLYAYIAKMPFGYFSAVYPANNPEPVRDNKLVNLQQPKTNGYKGKIVFLTDGLCFSTTADFCAIARSNRRGIFVGEETGGAYYGNTSGGTTRLELPNSKIQITIPRFKYINNVKKTKYADRGILPDHEIIPGMNQIISGKDIQMEFALKLLY